MVRLIVNIVFLVILAVFIALNAPYKTSVNIFGFRIEEVSVVAVIIVTLVIGVVYSFFFYASNYLLRAKKQKLKQKAQDTRQKAKQLEEKEQDIQSVALERADRDASEPAVSKPARSVATRSGTPRSAAAKGRNSVFSFLKRDAKKGKR